MYMKGQVWNEDSPLYPRKYLATSLMWTPSWNPILKFIATTAQEPFRLYPTVWRTTAEYWSYRAVQKKCIPCSSFSLKIGQIFKVIVNVIYGIRNIRWMVALPAWPSLHDCLKKLDLKCSCWSNQVWQVQRHVLRFTNYIHSDNKYFSTNRLIERALVASYYTASLFYFYNI